VLFRKSICASFSREKKSDEKTPHEYLSDQFGNDSFGVGILMVYFDVVAILKIPFIRMIEFTYSTGCPLSITSSPMPSKRPFFGCSPVPGKPSEQRIVIWSAEFSLNDRCSLEARGRLPSSGARKGHSIGCLAMRETLFGNR
jgi:hypothetical protein